MCSSLGARLKYVEEVNHLQIDTINKINVKVAELYKARR